ncbi:ABC transporter permease [Sinomicrobium sp. M5D2P17]
MIRNHLKIAWRSLLADRKFSLINIVGLAIGLSISLLLFLFVIHERSFNQMYANKDHIYRMLLHTEGDHGEEIWCNAPAALAPALSRDIPGITSSVRMLKHDFGDRAFVNVNLNNKQLIEPLLYWCDDTFFTIFDSEFIQGEPEKALTRPNTVVLSETTARRYFGDRDPMGQMITVDYNIELEVTGVIKDLPDNSTIDANVIASFKTLNYYRNPSWGNASFETYCLVSDTFIPETAEKEIQQMLDRYVKKEEQWYHFSLQPLEKVHLYSVGYTNLYSSRKGSIREVRIFSFLALLILLIACINYMNLATARSQKRTKDVGISKTLGASTRNLISRFYTETALITGIAIILGVLLAFAAVPLFNSITEKQLDINLVFSLKFITAILVVWILTSFIAGSYPALYLSGVSPKEVMSTSARQGNMAGMVRKGLVILQFSASVVLIIGVTVIYQQIQFILQKDLGYDPENVVAISAAVAVKNNSTEALLDEFRKAPPVLQVSMAQGFPGMEVSGRSLYVSENDPHGISLQSNRADHTVTEVLGLRLLAGRPLPRFKQEQDTTVDVILNKKAVDYLGYTPEEAIGKRVHAGLGNNSYITGVVNDFNFSSLHSPIGAYSFHNGSMEPKRRLLVRFNSDNLPATLRDFKTRFKKIVPDSAFDYTFLDKNTEQLYAAEKRTARVGLVFSALAIFVACLGLFGLAAFTAEQRNKEIGIRKVLGASVFRITRLLSKDFLKLVCLALIIAFPLAYWLMDKWLREFAYRIEISWVTFLVTGISALLITLITISFQSIKAAMLNPVKTLKAE